ASITNPLKYFKDAFTGATVAIGIAGLCHGTVISRIVQQHGYFFHDQIVVGTDQLYGAGSDGFGTFSGIAHHQHGLAKAGGFFLYASTVGEYERTLFHKIDKREVLQRLNKED